MSKPLSILNSVFPIRICDNGGSLTILCNAAAQVERAMLRAIQQEDPCFKNIPVYLSRYGLQVWKQDHESSR